MWRVSFRLWGGLPATVSSRSLPYIRSNAHPRTPIDFGWLYGDVIAGLTVGIVVVPQSMSYAQVRCLLCRYVVVNN